MIRANHLIEAKRHGSRLASYRLNSFHARAAVALRHRPFDPRPRRPAGDLRQCHLDLHRLSLATPELIQAFGLRETVVRKNCRDGIAAMAVATVCIQVGVGKRISVLSVSGKSPLSAEEHYEQPTHHEKEKEVNHDLYGHGIVSALSISAN
jgi:hypothetical protein